MLSHSIEQAKRIGFTAIQLNLVVSTNETAIRLWKKFGFNIIGTIPNGFKHATLGFPDASGAVCLITADPKVPNGEKLF